MRPLLRADSLGRRQRIRTRFGVTTLALSVAERLRYGVSAPPTVSNYAQSMRSTTTTRSTAGDHRLDQCGDALRRGCPRPLLPRLQLRVPRARRELAPLPQPR